MTSLPESRVAQYAERYLAGRLGDSKPLCVETTPSRLRAHPDALLPDAPLEAPWLFLLRAEGWLHDGERKKEERGDSLVRDDLELLRPVLAAHVKSGQAGVCVISVQGVDSEHAKGFRTNTLRLADRLGLERAVLGEDAGSARNLAVVMSSLEDVAAETAEAWHSRRDDG